jgi:multimeric flavodoxin WrbA
MNVVAFNGSPRADGNTRILIDTVLAELQAEGIDTEVVQLGGQAVRGCTACKWCFEHQEQRCVIDEDLINDCIAKMIEADGILLASPTYFADVSTEMKALIDRAGFVTLANGRVLKRKVGAGITAVRRGGQTHTFDTMNHFFLISEMIIPGSIYWNMGIGLDPGDVRGDEEGMRTMQTLGRNMAWLLRKTASET